MSRATKAYSSARAGNITLTSIRFARSKLNIYSDHLLNCFKNEMLLWIHLFVNCHLLMNKIRSFDGKYMGFSLRSCCNTNNFYYAFFYQKQSWNVWNFLRFQLYAKRFSFQIVVDPEISLFILNYVLFYELYMVSTHLYLSFTNIHQRIRVNFYSRMVNFRYISYIEYFCVREKKDL